MGYQRGKVEIDHFFSNLLSQSFPPAPCPLHHTKYTGSDRRTAVIANAALDTERTGCTQIPLYALDPYLQFFSPLKWRERIK